MKLGQHPRIQPCERGLDAQPRGVYDIPSAAQVLGQSAVFAGHPPFERQHGLLDKLRGSSPRAWGTRSMDSFMTSARRLVMTS